MLFEFLGHLDSGLCIPSCNCLLPQKHAQVSPLPRWQLYACWSASLPSGGQVTVILSDKEALAQRGLMAKVALPCFYFILTCEVLIDIENKFGRNYVDVHF